MPRIVLALTLFALVVVAPRRFAAAADPPPAWAYPTNSMPSARGCNACHLTSGRGRPDSAALAGLPATYIAQQLADYRRGVRKSAEPGMGPAEAMIAVASSTSDADVEKSSQHFAALGYGPWVRVVESDVDHIIEVAADAKATAAGDDGAGFVAYVPVGSIKRGEALVTTGGGGRTVRCALCHGDELKGLGPVPGLAGRSPSYQVRQLYDMQRGTRHGLGSDLMRATVARLATADMMAIAAYTASRHP